MLQAMLLAAIVLKASEHNLVAGVAGLVFASLVWLPVTRRWSARAHVCWASSVFLFVVYLTYALEWTFHSHLGAASTVGGVLLWLLEVFAALLCCAYLWEICDALGTEHWRRRITPTTRLSVPDSELPMISLHVPAHNEPPGMVIETLRSLLRLDYPRYEVILIDDNTDDESLWRPVEAWCDRHGVKFAHLDNWPGYKSGALNYALHKLTSPDAELIGVVDSDYQLQPGFLPPRPRAPRPLRAPLRAPVPPRPPHRPPPPRPPPPQLCPPHRLPPPQSPPRLPDPVPLGNDWSPYYRISLTKAGRRRLRHHDRRNMQPAGRYLDADREHKNQANADQDLVCRHASLRSC